MIVYMCGCNFVTFTKMLNIFLVFKIIILKVLLSDRRKRRWFCL